MKLETRQNMFFIGCILYVYVQFRMHITLFISFIEMILRLLSSHYRPVKIIIALFTYIYINIFDLKS